MENARLLVVDDEESMCKFMQIFLSKEGYDVTATADPTDAVAKIEKEDYDLLIADLMMPEMSGLELLARAKGIDPGLNVIVMTAFASVDSAIEALKKGASDYVTKPFKVDEIKIAIEKALEQKKIVRENASLKRQLKKEFHFANLRRIGHRQRVSRAGHPQPQLAGRKTVRFHQLCRSAGVAS